MIAPISYEIDPIRLPDEAATAALGARLAGLSRSGDVICLRAELGAGKTSFSRGFIRALCGDATEVPSPTYTLVQTYDGPEFEIWHFDLYRLKSPSEVYALGIEDALLDGVCLIEWPERLGSLSPDGTLDIEIKFDDECRTAHLSFPPHWQNRFTEGQF